MVHYYNMFTLRNGLCIFMKILKIYKHASWYKRNHKMKLDGVYKFIPVPLATIGIAKACNTHNLDAF